MQYFNFLYVKLYIYIYIYIYIIFIIIKKNRKIIDAELIKNITIYHSNNHKSTKYVVGRQITYIRLADDIDINSGINAE